MNEETPTIALSTAPKSTPNLDDTKIFDVPPSTPKSGATSIRRSYPKPDLLQDESMPGPSYITEPNTPANPRVDQDVADYLVNAIGINYPNALSNPTKLSRNKKRVDEFINDAFKACPTFSKPAQVKTTKILSYQECDIIISGLEGNLNVILDTKNHFKTC